MTRVWINARPRRLILSIVLIYGTLSIFYFSFAYLNQTDAYFRYNWLSDRIRSPPPRILCAIMTISDHHKTKAAAVRDTWANRCDSTIFFTNNQEPAVLQNFSSIVLNVSAGREFLWEKTRAAFLYMQENYGDRFDWFLKSDDDTYFIIDNLRFLLSSYDPNDRTWFGCEFVHHTSKRHFPSGGAGYVLSRGALDGFAEAVRNESEISPTPTPTSHFHGNATPPLIVHGCGTDGGSMGEDVRFSVCLESAGAKLIDAQASDGAFRFLPTMLEYFVVPEKNGGNGWITMYRTLKQGIGQCCDTRLISIHYASPKLMYVYEFLIYHLKVANGTVIT